jgi:acetyl esterase/lipase
MSRPVLALAAALAAAVPAFADLPTLDLWPGVAPGEKGNVPPEQVQPQKPGENPPVQRITNVSKPTVTVYKPAKDRDTGAAIVVAPGGGYNILAYEHEGTQVAEWLSSVGVTAVLLKYRVPRRPDQPKDAPPIGALQDAQRAIGLTRSKAKEWGLDPTKIGMLGFSAGGHLTAWAATNYEKRAYEPVDDADRVSCRPDFAVLIYPGGLLERGSKAQLRPEIAVTKDTPPCFLAVAYNDEGSLPSTLAMLAALKAAKVPAELHVYATGGHGFGMRKSDQPYATWPKRVEDWLRATGVTGKK